MPHGNASDVPGPNNVAHLESRQPPILAADYTDEMINTVRIMTDAMVRLLRLIQGAPNEMFENLFFKKTSETVHNLLLQKPITSTPSQVAAKEQSQTTNDDDEFWFNPEHISSIEEIEKALAKISEYERNVDDIRSFSLVLSLTEDNDARDVQQSEKPSESKNNTIVDPVKSRIESKMMSEFIDRVKTEVNAFPWVKLSEVEMFFFPIYQMNHFFLICIDLKDMELVIIDNSTAMEKEKDGLKLKYGAVPSLLMMVPLM
ncbi:hypothetical protein C2S52_015192 [Perilla frutescens var. hirtella]|nr:hypothetical protein C2S52_015192 [Perilla frutescens var. hirtella]